MVDGGASPVGSEGEHALETVREERLQQGWRKELSQQGPREELHQQSRREELLQQGQREECSSRARVGIAPAGPDKGGAPGEKGRLRYVRGKNCSSRTKGQICSSKAGGKSCSSQSKGGDGATAVTGDPEGELFQQGGRKELL